MAVKSMANLPSPLRSAGSAGETKENDGGPSRLAIMSGGVITISLIVMLLMV